MKYYLYRHIRNDINQPFYIGIGTKSNKSKYSSVEYNRAFNKSRRNKIWRRIINKTDYEVEILLESDNYDFIKSKEKEFIKLYGRINTKSGTLANLTDGGEGTVNLILSEETKSKISNNNRNKGKFGKDNIKSKIIYQYDLEGNFIKEWFSLADVSRYFNNGNPNYKPVTTTKSYKGFQWRWKFEGDKISPIDYTRYNEVKRNFGQSRKKIK